MGILFFPSNLCIAEIDDLLGELEGLPRILLGEIVHGGTTIEAPRRPRLDVVPVQLLGGAEDVLRHLLVLFNLLQKAGERVAPTIEGA